MKSKKFAKKWKSKINFHGIPPLKFMKFHDAIREALKESIFDIEKENLFLKEKIKELEKSIIPKPLYVEPITTIKPILTLKDVSESGSKLKGSSSLLMVVRKYVGDGIEKRIDLILEIWELSQS